MEIKAIGDLKSMDILLKGMKKNRIVKVRDIPDEELPVMRDDEGILAPHVVRDILEARKLPEKDFIPHARIRKMLGLHDKDRVGKKNK